MYSWFTLHQFKWLLVEVLAKLSLAVLYKEGTMVSQVGQSGLMVFLDKFDQSSFQDN